MDFKDKKVPDETQSSERMIARPRISKRLQAFEALALASSIEMDLLTDKCKSYFGLLLIWIIFCIQSILAGKPLHSDTKQPKLSINSKFRKSNI